MTRRRAESGLTLIELVAVCAIVAVMFGVAVVRIDSLVPKYRLRGAGRGLATVLRQAKARAAATGREVYVEMDLSKGTYWILASFPKLLEDGRVAEPKAFEYQRVFPGELPEGVDFANVVLGPRDRADRGVARVRMDPLGASNHVIVNLRNREPRDLAIRLNGFTGHVSFYDEHRDAEDLIEDR